MSRKRSISQIHWKSNRFPRQYQAMLVNQLEGVTFSVVVTGLAGMPGIPWKRSEVERLSRGTSNCELEELCQYRPHSNLTMGVPPWIFFCLDSFLCWAMLSHVEPCWATMVGNWKAWNILAMIDSTSEKPLFVANAKTQCSRLYICFFFFFFFFGLYIVEIYKVLLYH